MQKVVVIQGPTASGKSSLALQVALKLNGEIISADSRQVYRFMDIGTAKPTIEQQQQVKHHLVDIIDPDKFYSAGQFALDAAQAVSDITNRGKLPIICGGTGFYIKALLNGLCEEPVIPQEVRTQVRQDIAQQGSQAMHKQLAMIDQPAAQRIKPADAQRIARALEVYRATGQTLTQLWQQQQQHNPYKSFNICLWPHRPSLYQAINQRVATMMQQGLLDEITGLVQKGYSFDTPGLNTVGYKEFAPYFAGTASVSDCAEQVAQSTRNYAKRQFTWLRKVDLDLTIDGDLLILSEIINQIKSFITV